MRIDRRVWRLALLSAVFLGCRTADRVVLPPHQAAGRRPLPAPIEVSRALSETITSYVLNFVFQEPGKPAVPVRFEVAKSSFNAVDRPWGYREGDLRKFEQAYEASRRAAFADAQAHEALQSQLDAELNNLHDGAENAKHDYVLSRGFRFLADGSTKVDMAALVRASAPRLAPLARAIEFGAQAGGRPRDWIIGASEAMVQTALAYRAVPAVIDGIHTGGVWPPVMTLLYGSGDCDTKAALLAALLSNYPGTRILGVEISGHYLLGISQKPARGDAYIRFQGRKYILFEPAGPSAIIAGEIADETESFFKQGRPYTVERLF
jgi:hypothetical protein